jgi:poly(glycerol-phosphate) alpha-glucosyltransferase
MLGLSTALAERGGSRVAAISASDSCSSLDIAAWGGIPVTHVATDGILDLLTGRRLGPALDAAKPDLVHLHGIWGIASRGLHWWLKKHQIPYVVSPHGMLDSWALGRSWMKKRVAGIVWEDSLLRGAAFLHALNEAEANSIRALGLRNPIRVVPNGVKLPAVGKAAVPLSGAPDTPQDTRRSMLFIGRLHPKKGLTELILAWSLLPADVRAQWRLRIAGWDEIGLLGKLKTLTQALKLGEDIEFLGGVFGDEKDAVFRAASAFILPSYSEGLPIAVLEAWSYGVPVFMTPACNLVKGFAAGAAFEIATDPVAIADILMKTLDNAPALELSGQQGRILVERDHGWRTIALAMHDAYAGAIGQGDRDDGRSGSLVAPIAIH